MSFQTAKRGIITLFSIFLILMIGCGTPNVNTSQNTPFKYRCSQVQSILPLRRILNIG